MSQPLTALRLRAALHLLSLEGADISNIVRAHAQSLGLQMDVCQPLSRESAAALDAVVALAAHINESAFAASAAAPSSYEGIECGTDWFGESSLGEDFGDFAFPALQHREGGGQMTFQVRNVFRFLFCVSNLRAFFGCGFFSHSACSLQKLFRALSIARAASLLPMKTSALTPYWQVHAATLSVVLPTSTDLDFSLQKRPQTLGLQRSWLRLQPTTYHITLMAMAMAYRTFHLRHSIRRCPPHRRPVLWLLQPSPPKNQLPPMRKSRRESAQSPMFIGAMLQLTCSRLSSQLGQN